MFENKLVDIIYSLIPMIILFIIMAILLKIVSIGMGKRKGNIWIEFKILIYIIYSFVLFELVTTSDFSSYSNNYIPFKEIFRYDLFSPLFMRNVLGNILLFVPFGYLITDVLKMICNKKNFIVSTIFVLLISLSIESIQYFIGRAFDIDDIILNFIGGVLGYILYVIIHIIFKENENE